MNQPETIITGSVQATALSTQAEDALPFGWLLNGAPYPTQPPHSPQRAGDAAASTDSTTEILVVGLPDGGNLPGWVLVVG